MGITLEKCQSLVTRSCLVLYISFLTLESDPVFMEIENTIKAKPDQAKTVNSVYIFVIKSGGKPVKRWCKY